MKPFSNKRPRRNTAVAALLVWLFALSLGIANACLLEAPIKHTHSHSQSHTHSHVAEEKSELHHPHVGLTGHSEATEGNEHDSDVPKDACLKVCDDGSKASVKLRASPDLLDPGMPPVVAIVWNAATPVACAPSDMDDPQPPIAGPPVRVRFPRLALWLPVDARPGPDGLRSASAFAVVRPSRGPGPPFTHDARPVLSTRARFFISTV